MSQDTPTPSEPSTSEASTPKCPSWIWTLIWFFVFPIINFIQFVKVVNYLNAAKKAGIKPEGSAWVVLVLSLADVIAVVVGVIMYVVVADTFISSTSN